MASGLTPARRGALLTLSLFMLALGLGWDLLRAGGSPGVGPLQILVGVAGLAGALLAVLPEPARTPYARALLALGSAYASALAVELVLLPPIASWALTHASLRGAVRPSSWGGYELTPGWRGRYEDGIRPVDIEINALGDRDDFPAERDAAADERVLLLGDSYAFGYGLDKHETIEAQIELESGGRVVAYNRGVAGYGPGDTLAHYREQAVFPASHTFFLLYGNDLRLDNCTAGLSTAVDGVVVQRAHGGEAPDPVEVAGALERAASEDVGAWRGKLKSVLLLRQLRGRLAGGVLGDLQLASGDPTQYSLECTLAAAAHMEQMREIARARREEFAVVVLPTPAEAHRGVYFDLMQACLRELEKRGIRIIELRDRLERSDYFQHHEHLNPSGARKVAEAILASLGSGAVPAVAR